MNEYIMITGASSGIGRAIAEDLAGEGKPLILVARRKERLEELAKRYPEVTIRSVSCDLSSAVERRGLMDRCSHEGWLIQGLVNNAGLGSQHRLLDTPEEKMDSMLDVNIQALVELTRFALPSMVEKKSGWIVNIASTAAFQPVPFFSLYASTKAFVLHFTEALSEEYRESGVFIGVMCPGPVSTEFQEQADMGERWFAVSQRPEEVARAVRRQIEKRQVVAWSSLAQQVTSSLISFFPRSWIRRLAYFIMLKAGAR
ncbi:MAG: SDR family oxidoreductase [Verrucomicrobiota bacterium]